jgi:hypothetical protein
MTTQPDPALEIAQLKLYIRQLKEAGNMVAERLCCKTCDNHYPDMCPKCLAAWDKWVEVL